MREHLQRECRFVLLAPYAPSVSSAWFVLTDMKSSWGKQSIILATGHGLSWSKLMPGWVLKCKDGTAGVFPCGYALMATWL